MAAYLDRAAVGAIIGVGVATVTKYRRRYAGTATPFPEPDLELAGHPGWSADRAEEIQAWATSRPGRTGRPPKEAS